MTEAQEAVRWRELAVLVTILLAATALRTWRLSGVPPGLTHDEAGHGHDAIAILDGARPIYETVGYGREPLYDYWVAGLMVIGGRTREVLRFSAVPLGLTTILATFAWTRLAYDGTVALASVALQSAAFWSLSTGRQALRSSLLPALFTAAVFFFWRSIHDAEQESSRWRWGVLALLIGATLYTYVPARVLWVVFPAFVAYLALFHRSTVRRIWGPTLITVGLGLLLAVPLLLYLRSHPGAEQRLTMLDAPLQALLKGDPSVILNRAGQFLSGLFIPGRGDDFLAYTIPGRPVFGPLTGGLFLLGVGICLARWRDPASALSLIWLLVGVSPSLVTGSAASTTRSIAALPVIFVFPAVAVAAVIRWARKRWGELGRWTTGLAWCGLVFFTGVSSARDYFVVWAASPHTRAAYQHTLVETAAYLDARWEDGSVGISTAQPHAPHDPYVFQVSLDRRDLSVRWFDARRALILPPRSHARLVVPSSASLSRSFGQLPGLLLQERVEMRPDDLDPWFEVYEWRPRATLAALHGAIQDGRVSASLGAALSSEGGEEGDLRLPATFGGALDLLGYQLQTRPAAPGGEIELITLWRVRAPDVLQAGDLVDVEREPVLFAHALDDSGALVAQEDRLDAPAWSWQEGDVVAQIHRLSLPTDLSEGPVTLAVGIYRRTDMARLPVSVDGQMVGDHVFLSPVNVVE